MPEIRDPDFDPDNIPKRKEEMDADWKTICPVCESLVLEHGGKYKCGTCGHVFDKKKT